MHGRITKTLTIGNGASLSDAAEDLRGWRLAAIQMPSAWTAANLTFQAAEGRGGTYQDVHDSDGNELTVTAADSRYIHLGEQDVEELRGAWGVKVRSGTSATAVNQGADRELVLVLVKG